MAATAHADASQRTVFVVSSNDAQGVDAHVAVT